MLMENWNGTQNYIAPEASGFMEQMDPLTPPAKELSTRIFPFYTDGSARRPLGAYQGGYGGHFPTCPQLDYSGPLLGPTQTCAKPWNWPQGN